MRIFYILSSPEHPHIWGCWLGKRESNERRGYVKLMEHPKNLIKRVNRPPPPYMGVEGVENEKKEKERKRKRKKGRIIKIS